MTEDLALQLNHGDKVEARIEGTLVLNGVIHIDKTGGKCEYYLEHDGTEFDKNIFDGGHKKVFGRRNSWFFYRKGQSNFPGNYLDEIEIIRKRKFLPELKKVKEECM